ncbi:replication fork protection component Swi3-domain-containing protein [Cercophora newfieldiana]|uniref:Chromosome segregation in meiosis protein n=1 Tax=Cercophora newfieldiana TaxID=92897 RepID=A0AA39YMD3_9PEZI|nr:replication fork protection component Swi3-domain-containing protein [Cercophora newfieldiana]
MPSKTANQTSQNKGPAPDAFVEDYLAGWDDEDPFASPEPPSKSNGANDKKRKGTDALGIDEEIDLKKKPRVPRVKLDEGRLLSEKGIPKLRKMAPRLKLKGKGHEFSDASRLLSFYQEWLDDLFPKATFLDALAMVEKTGHKTIMRNERLKWIEEGRPKAQVEDDDLFGDKPSSAPPQPTRIAPIFEQAAGARATTPTNDNLFVDDDIYNATPRARPQPPKPTDDVPDDDDLEALMAEQDAASAAAPAFGSIFGGTAKKATQPSGEPDEDEMDALMAEAELSQPSRPTQPPVRNSIFGDGSSKAPSKPVEDDEYGDDLDALMAEAEAEAEAPRPGAKEAPKDQQPSAEDEEAMAEMEGLW